MLGFMLAGALALTSPSLLSESLHFEAPSSVSLTMPEASGGPLPAALSLVIPGLGQLVNGQPGKGALMFLGVGVTGLLGIGLVQVGPDGGRNTATWAGLGLLGTAALICLWSIVDAWFGDGGEWSGGDVWSPGGDE